MTFSRRKAHWIPMPGAGKSGNYMVRKHGFSFTGMNVCIPTAWKWPSARRIFSEHASKWENSQPGPEGHLHPPCSGIPGICGAVRAVTFGTKKRDGAFLNKTGKDTWPGGLLPERMHRKCVHFCRKDFAGTAVRVLFFSGKSGIRKWFWIFSATVTYGSPRRA